MRWCAPIAANPEALIAMERLSRACSSSCLRTPECTSSVPSSSVPASLVAALVASSSSFIASVPPSLALRYDDFARKAENVRAASDGSLVDFVSGNPLVAVAAVAAVAVPVIALRASASQSFGSVSAAAAFANLAESQSAQLLDIRAAEEVRAEGRPDLKALRKKALQVVYEGGGDAAFVAKVGAKCRNAESTTLFILDSLDGNSLAAAKLLANNGFQKAYAIKGGVQGLNGWQRSELPWLMPRKAFSLNLDGLKTLLAGTQDNANVVPALGAAAAAGVGVAVFTEAETVLQLLGSAAFIQIFAKKFMFADDREKTIKEIQKFLDTKIAPQEFVDELKEVGRVLLPKDEEVDVAVDVKKLKGVDSGAPIDESQIQDAGAA